MIKIFPLGESALTIEFADEISPEINDQVIDLANRLEAHRFAGFVEAFPAYASLTIFYDVTVVRKHFPEFSTAFETVKSLAENALRNSPEIKKTASRLVEIPVCFDQEYALDFGFIAENNNLSAREVIEIFTGQTYRVYMLGFLPGFAYLGEIDARIAAPRKPAPRLKVPAGSVAIAGRQTGVYPLASPGGWQIIGRTNVELFAANAENPFFLRAGDAVKFYETKNLFRAG